MKAMMDDDRRSRVRGLAVVLAGLAVAGAPLRAHAQAPAAEDASKAQALFDEGKKQYAAGKVQKAYDAYRGAWELRKSYDIAANLANAEKLLGKNRDAAEHYAYSLRTFPATGKPAQQKQLEAKLAEVRRELGALAVEVCVAGAEVRVDETPIGAAPLADEVFVEPGPHVVEARLAGYATATQNVLAGKGTETVKVVLTLVERKAARVGEGQAAGQGGHGATPGDGQAKSVDHGAGLPLGTAGPNRGLLLGGGVLAAVGLGVGIGLTVAASGKTAEANGLLAKLEQGGIPGACLRAPADCQAVESVWQSRNVLSRAGVGSFIGAGVVAAATVSYGVIAALSARPKQETNAPRVLPQVGYRQGGLVVVGSF